MKLLTNLIFQPKGKHDPALTYSIKDTVMSPDGSKVYFALRDVPSGIALTDEDYWMLQIDLSGSKNAMDEAVAAFSDYAKIVGTRVKGETAKATGNPVSFLPDAGSLLQPVTVLEPQQSGSGDPYPAGGGRNKLRNTATTQTINGVTFTVNADGTVTVDGTATANAVFRIPCNLSVGETYTLSGCPSGGDTSTYFMQLGYFGNDTGNGVTATATEQTGTSVALLVMQGITVSNLLFKPMIRLASDPDSTYAPYENIRPITGWDAVEMNHSGKNLLPNMATSQTIKGVTFTVNADGSVTANGTATADATLTIANTTGAGNVADFTGYVLNGCPVGGSPTTYFIRYSNKVNGTANAYGDDTIIGCDYTGEFTVSVRVKSGYTASNLVFKPMIRIASDPDATYAPYQGTTHAVQIGQTVYGGKLDWMTGKLTVDKKKIDLGAYTWTYDSVYGRFASNSDSVLKKPTKSRTEPFVCSCYTVIDDGRGISEVPNCTIYTVGLASGTIFYVHDNRYTDFANFTQAIAGQEVVYPLATPIEIQLTPHILTAVDPEQNNTLYGDGSIEVEYVKPLHVSIEERVAAALAAATE